MGGYEGASPIKPSKTTKEYGARHNSSDKKSSGYFGEIKANNGDVITELSVGVNIDGKEVEIPSIVPTLTSEEIKMLAAGGEPNETIIRKAVDHAKARISEKKSPFWTPGDKVYKLNDK